MDFQAEQWYNGGFRGQASRPEKGTIIDGDVFRVADLWCSIWYTKFVGTKQECENWLLKQREKDARFGLNIDYKIEKYFDIWKSS